MKNAISLVDGRNEADTKELKDYYSEEALNFFRLGVEIRWLFLLSGRKDIPLRKFTDKEEKLLNNIIKDFSDQDTERIKEIEGVTNHDVKAVELFLKEKLEQTSLKDIVEWIHFSCTSEDINNISWSLIFKESIEEVVVPNFEKIKETVKKMAKDWKSIPMLSRTHGQPATPTTIGKEFLVFVLRLERQIDQLKKQDYLGKFAGATGNFAAHSIAFPDVDWIELSKEFVESFGLTWNPVVTQIEPHDFIAEFSHTIYRLNTILTDLARDIWGLISLDYCKQKAVATETGSSTMPHKVNPIDFENAEGNFGVANSLFIHFSTKLPISRFQRDLSDSTVLRSIGTAFGHTLIALRKLSKGLSKIEVNEEKLLEDLKNSPAILGEAIQTVMRKNGVEDAYGKLKDFTRGKEITLENLREFIKSLDINKDDKKRLLELNPEQFFGLAPQIVEKFSN